MFDLAEEIEATRDNLNQNIGRKLGARVLRSWVEDFVDEDTGEVVTVERNEILLERDTLLGEESIDKIIETNQELNLTKEERSNEFSIIYNTLAQGYSQLRN